MATQSITRQRATAAISILIALAIGSAPVATLIALSAQVTQ